MSVVALYAGSFLQGVAAFKPMNQPATAIRKILAKQNEE
jgi:hypothetical protein